MSVTEFESFDFFSTLDMDMSLDLNHVFELPFDFGAIPQTALQFDFCMCKIVSEP